MIPLILGVALVVLVWSIVRRGSTPRIDTRRCPDGIAVLEQVPVNGTMQWVLIRSEDVANRVVLFLHGGPGTSWLTLMRKNTRALERYFTVVNWDQRGACKSFAAGHDRARMTMPQFVDDVIALSAYLTSRFGKEKILLVGHSWGSAIGMLAIARRPDLFAGYVGIGQVSCMAEGEQISYAWVMEQARKAGDASTVRKLTKIAPPPYTGSNWRSRYMTERRLLAKYGGEYYESRIGALGVVLKNLIISREYTLIDRVNFFRGIALSVDALYPELARTDLFTEVPEVKVPIYFCLGRHDYEVPSSLSAKYFTALRAPRRQLIWFERSAHLPNSEEPEKFSEFMIRTVLAELPEQARSTGQPQNILERERETPAQDAAPAFKLTE
jgi:pimeloyl-ACP methyl ester carboxylesterase